MSSPISSQEQIRELVEENEFLKAAATTNGFFRLYFDSLPKHRTQVECFNALNDKYLELTGHYKFSDYHSFANIVRYHNKKKRNK